ncbi:hypothetical protein EON81_04400 [bacterium]|nr:MAG: hypothetical protein EON81_04400 [bacterium]
MPLLLTALALPHAATVTVNLPATRLETALPAIGQAAGVKMEATAAMANEIMLVRVENVELETLLAKIAEAMAGEWKFDGTTYRLMPNVAIRNAEQRTELTAKIAAINKSLLEQINPPKPEKGSPEANYQEAEGVEEMQEDGERTLAQIVALIGAPTLANMAPGARLVFADRPNGSQRPLPGNAMGLVAKLIKEHNASLANMPEDADIPDSPEIPEFVRKMMEARSKPIANPAKVILSIGGSTFSSGNAKLTFYAQDGTVMGQKEVYLALGDGGVMSMLRGRFGSTGEEAEDETAPLKKKTPVVYSDDTKALKEQMGYSGGMKAALQMRMTLSPALQTKIFQPDQFDPLSFAPTDEIVAFAKLKGRPIVASIPDTAVSLYGFEQNIEDLAATWRNGEGMKLTETDGWLVLRPSAPVENRTNLVSRPDLARLMGASLAKGFPSLEDIAAYSVNNPSAMENGVSQTYLMGFVPGMSGGMMNPFQSSWESYRLFGRLSSLQKTILRRGEPVPFTQLGGPALVTILFGAATRITEEGAAEKDVFSMAMDSVMASGGAEQEPTEVMPNGIPAGGYLTAAVREEPFATPAGEGLVKAPFAALGPDELAMFRFFTEDKNFKQYSEYMPKLDQLKIGRRTIWDLSFHVAKGQVIRATLMDHRMDAKSASFGSDGLPKELDDLVAKRLEAIKKSPMGAMGGMMGGMGGNRQKP